MLCCMDRWQLDKGIRLVRPIDRERRVESIQTRMVGVVIAYYQFLLEMERIWRRI